MIITLAARGLQPFTLIHYQPYSSLSLFFRLEMDQELTRSQSDQNFTPSSYNVCVYPDPTAIALPP